MKAVTVAIVVTDNFSPFHFSVPCILFGDKVSDSGLFSVKICAETLGTIVRGRFSKNFPKYTLRY